MLCKLHAYINFVLVNYTLELGGSGMGFIRNNTIVSINEFLPVSHYSRVSDLLVNYTQSMQIFLMVVQYKYFRSNVKEVKEVVSEERYHHLVLRISNLY